KMIGTISARSTCRKHIPHVTCRTPFISLKIRLGFCGLTPLRFRHVCLKIQNCPFVLSAPVGFTETKPSLQEHTVSFIKLKVCTLIKMFLSPTSNRPYIIWSPRCSEPKQRSDSVLHIFLLQNPRQRWTFPVRYAEAAVVSCVNTPAGSKFWGVAWCIPTCCATSILTLKCTVDSLSGWALSALRR